MSFNLHKGKRIDFYLEKWILSQKIKQLFEKKKGENKKTNVPRAYNN